MAASTKAMNDVIVLFKEYDKDGNGELSPEELSAVLSRLSPAFTQEKVQEIFRAMDIDGDGKVSVKEFVAWVFGGDENASNIVIEDLSTAILSLQELSKKGQEDASSRFWGRARRDAEKAEKSLQEYCERWKSFYSSLLKHQLKFPEYNNFPTKNYIVRPALTKDNVEVRQKADYRNYSKMYKADVAANSVGLAQLTHKELKDRWPGRFAASDVCTIAEELLRFARRGGTVPKGLEEDLLGRRSLIPAWKKKAKELKGAFLVTKERPGAEREAVYQLLDADLLKAKVGVLSAVKWQPELLASKDASGVYTLPLNEAQRVFDALRPAQLLGCLVDVNNQMSELISFWSHPAEAAPPESGAGLPRIPFEGGEPMGYGLEGWDWVVDEWEGSEGT